LIGLKPEEFYKLTIQEFTTAVNAHGKKRQEEWLRTAWLASWIINVQLPRGKNVTPQKLLGAEFFGEPEKSPYKSREVWEKAKTKIIKMARWHSKIMRHMEAESRKGKKTSRTVSIGDFMKRTR